MASHNDSRDGDRARLRDGKRVHMRDGNNVQLMSGIRVRTFYTTKQYLPSGSSVYVGGDSDPQILKLDLGLTPDQLECANKTTLWNSGLYFGPVELMKVVIDDYEGATFRLVCLGHHICIG